MNRNDVMLCAIKLNQYTNLENMCGKMDNVLLKRRIIPVYVMKA